MRPTSPDIIAGLLVFANDFPSLPPFKIIRVEERVDKDDDVHEWGAQKVEEVTYEVLHTLQIVAWQPEANAK